MEKASRSSKMLECANNRWALLLLLKTKGAAVHTGAHENASPVGDRELIAVLGREDMRR